MRPFLSFFRWQRYTLLQTPEGSKDGQEFIFKRERTNAWSNKQILFLFLSSVILAGGLGFVGGVHLKKFQTRHEGEFSEMTSM